MKLTNDEKELLLLTAELWNKFCALPDKHPNDVEEFHRDIHNIQRRIMARVAFRSEPDFFTPRNS